MMAHEIGKLKTVADLWIAAECTGAAARHVGENEVIGWDSKKLGGVSELHFYFRGVLAAGNSRLQSLTAAGADFERGDPGLRVALGEYQRFAARGCAAIKDFPSLTGQLRDEL